MICKWCDQEFEINPEYQNLQQTMSIKPGIRFSEQQIINGSLCLDCYQHHIKLSRIGPTCLRCGGFLYFTNAANYQARQSDSFYQWAKEHYFVKYPPSKILAILKDREASGLNKTIYERAAAHEEMCIGCLQRVYRRQTKHTRVPVKPISYEPDYSDSAQARDLSREMKIRLQSNVQR